MISILLLTMFIIPPTVYMHPYIAPHEEYDQNNFDNHVTYNESGLVAGSVYHFSINAGNFSEQNNKMPNIQYEHPICNKWQTFVLWSWAFNC